MRFRLRPWHSLVLVLPAMSFALAPLPLAGQSGSGCASGTIREIRVLNGSVMDPDEIRGRPFAWAWEWVNRLHFRTRESFIRDDLLFKVGDCYDPVRLSDSERTLRSYPFIASASVEARPGEEGDWEVLVRTRDEWSTWPRLNIAVDGRLLFQGISLREGNLLGRGVTAGLFYSRVDESRNRGAYFRFPRLLGTRTDGAVSAGKTRIGEFVSLQGTYPFLGEVGRVAVAQRISYQDNYTRFGTGTRKGISHVLLPVKDYRADLTLARRWGSPGSLLEVAASLAHMDTDPSRRIEEVHIAYDDRFDELTPVPDSLFQAIVSETGRVRSTVAGAILNLREVRFVPRQGLELLEGIQDVGVGREVGVFLAVGLAGRENGAAASGDLLMGGHFFTGATHPQGLIQLRGLLEGRRARVTDGGGEAWRDIRAEGEATAYWTPAWWPGNLFGRLSYQGGWRVDRPYQSTLGGVGRVRGYFEEELPVGAGVVATLEARADLPWPTVVGLGFTGFMDLGQGWEEGVPFGRDTGWLSTLGGGIRLAFPSASATVLRIEGGWRLRETMRMEDLLVRAYFVDLQGIMGLRTDGGSRRFNGYLNRLRGY